MLNRKYKSWIIVLVVITMLGSLLTGCGGQNSKVSTKEKEPLKIGFIGPLTGVNAKGGKSMKQGMELALEEINAAGGVNGHELQAIYEDDEYNATKGKAVAEKLVSKDEVDIVIGSYSSASVMSFMDVTKKAKVPLIVPVAVGKAITESGNDWLFRNCATNNMQITQEMEYLLKNPDFKKYAVISENTDFGKEVAEIITKMVTDKGLELVAVESYSPGDTDFYSQLTKIGQQKPDVLFLGSNLTEVSQLVRQAREIGVTAQFAGTGAPSSPEFDKLVDGANEGMMCTSYFESATTNQLAIDFIKAYKAKYNEDADMFGAATYEAAYIAKEAMMKAGDEISDKVVWRTAVRDALKSFKDVPGVQGPTTFNEKGQAFKKIFIVQWKNHEKVVLQGQ